MTGMRLGKRTRKRGALDKALLLARGRAARLAAGPPLPGRFAADPRAAERLRGEPEHAWRVVDCDAAAGGTYEALERARAAVPDAGRPLLLAVDLFVHEAQIRRARHAGADGVVLVARVLDLAGLAALARAARERGLAVAIEVRSEGEIAAACAAHPDALVVASIDRDNGRPETAHDAVSAAATATGLRVVSPPRAGLARHHP